MGRQARSTRNLPRGRSLDQTTGRGPVRPYTKLVEDFKLVKGKGGDQSSSEASMREIVLFREIFRCIIWTIFS